MLTFQFCVSEDASSCFKANAIPITAYLKSQDIYPTITEAQKSESSHLSPFFFSILPRNITFSKWTINIAQYELIRIKNQSPLL